MSTISFSGQTVSQFSAIQIDTEYVDLGSNAISLNVSVLLSPTTDAMSSQRVISAALIVGSHAFNMGTEILFSGAMSHQGSGTVAAFYGLRFDSPVNSGGGTITDLFGFYLDEIGVSTNPHYLWFNSDGVLDIREASSQAILSLHNPGITKFTSGSANYERSVQQWASNILQIGAEKGGTGTLRKVRVLGAGLILSTDILPTSDPAVSGQLWNDSGTLKVSA